MKITTVSAKKIELFPNGDVYVLAVPDEKQFFDFWLMHDKMQSALHMFGTLRAQAPDDETLEYLAVSGWNEYREKYLAMLGQEYTAQEKEREEYAKLLNAAWIKYRHNWANSRGYDFRAVSRAFYRDEEYRGEMWAYLEEFEDCEFLIEEYMQDILSPAEFERWKAFIPENERQ